MNRNIQNDYIGQIIEILEKKGGNHNSYYHYTTWDSFEKIAIENRREFFKEENHAKSTFNQGRMVGAGKKGQ